MLTLLLACTGTEPPPVVEDTGEAGTPNILIDEAAVDFGLYDEVGGLHQELISVQNSGTADLVLTLAAPAPFLVLTEGEFTLGPQSTGQLSVGFEPTDYVLEQAATLVVSSNDPDRGEIEIPLTGGVVVDADGDGHLRAEAGGDDCDDSDDEIYPGAEDAFYDGVDADCAGDDDYDGDGDGFQADAFGGTDCNDAKDNIYPGAPDTWYDGVDSDCAGNNDFDQDLDGYGSKAHNKGKDCNDDDPDAYPGASERLNGVLDDCDGDKDWKVNPNTASTVLTGDDSNQLTGFSMAHGDWDSDGETDTIIGARNYGSSTYGQVFMIWGSDGFPEDTNEDVKGVASEYFDGEGSNNYLGGAMVALGDDMLAISAFGYSGSYGRIYVFDGYELTVDFDYDMADMVITGTSSHYYTGRGLSSGDLDGDGLEDLLFYYGSSTSSSAPHRIGLQYGDNMSSNFSASSVDSRWTVNTTTSATYENMSGGYDVDGDGYDDFVYSDYSDDTYENNSGAVWLLWGQASQFSSGQSTFSSYAETVMTGDTQDSSLVGTVSALLPDLNGDGYAEVASWGQKEGDLGILFGSPSMKGGGSTEISDSDIFINMNEGSSPTTLRPTGDFSGDGVDDWVLGIDSTSSSAGRMYIFSGDMAAGEYNSNDAVAYIQTSSEDENAYFGHAVPVYPGDADNDGKLDLLVGDYGWSGEINGDGSTHTNTGATYVFFGL